MCCVFRLHRATPTIPASVQADTPAKDALQAHQQQRSRFPRPVQQGEHRKDAGGGGPPHVCPGSLHSVQQPRESTKDSYGSHQQSPRCFIGHGPAPSLLRGMLLVQPLLAIMFPLLHGPPFRQASLGERWSCGCGYGWSGHRSLSRCGLYH